LLLAAAQAAGVSAQSDREALLAAPIAQLVRAIWAAMPPLPVDAEFPLFFIYTSGSTGKPKGVVHVHGGYVAGIAHTMRVSFDARPGDVIYVVADPGWITGQSYMISAALTTRVTTVITEGAPVFPERRALRQHHRALMACSIFKAGVTFLKTVMTDPQNVADVRRYSLSTRCASPPSAPSRCRRRAAVRHGAGDTLVHQLLLGHRARRHRLDAFLRQRRFPAARRCAHLSAALGVGDVWVPTANRR
jgi:acrylyl-CoA reductase (NADPH)/3-hydroxypropionyl-CoA dehydratase/3-hydroxypropionyl-CoA synthetase